MLELLGGLILALLAALGFQYGRSKNKEIAQKQAETDRANAVIAMQERARKAAEAAEANADQEYQAPVDTTARAAIESSTWPRK